MQGSTKVNPGETAETTVFPMIPRVIFLSTVS